jgi:hypothetical protein
MEVAVWHEMLSLWVLFALYSIPITPAFADAEDGLSFRLPLPLLRKTVFRMAQTPGDSNDTDAPS